MLVTLADPAAALPLFFNSFEMFGDYSGRVWLFKRGIAAEGEL